MKLKKSKKIKDEKRILFFEACTKGDLALVNRYIKKNNSYVGVFNEHKQNPLHVACKFGIFDVVRVLMNSKAETNNIDEFGCTPLLYAAQAQKEQVLFLLLENNEIKAALTDPDQNTAIHFLASNPCHEENHHIVHILIRKGVDINGKNSQGETALHKAASKQNILFVQILIDNKANLNVQNLQGETPLHTAARIGNIELVRLLINSGADVSVVGDMGTPVEICSKDPKVRPQLLELLQAKVFYTKQGSDNNVGFRSSSIYRRISKNDLLAGVNLPPDIIVPTSPRVRGLKDIKEELIKSASHSSSASTYIDDDELVVMPLNGIRVSDRNGIDFVLNDSNWIRELHRIDLNGFDANDNTRPNLSTILVSYIDGMSSDDERLLINKIEEYLTESERSYFQYLLNNFQLRIETVGEAILPRSSNVLKTLSSEIVKGLETIKNRSNQEDASTNSEHNSFGDYSSDPKPSNLMVPSIKLSKSDNATPTIRDSAGSITDRDRKEKSRRKSHRRHSSSDSSSDSDSDTPVRQRGINGHKHSSSSYENSHSRERSRSRERDRKSKRDKKDKKDKKEKSEKEESRRPRSSSSSDHKHPERSRSDHVKSKSHSQSRTGKSGSLPSSPSHHDRRKLRSSDGDMNPSDFSNGTRKSRPEGPHSLLTLQEISEIQDRLFKQIFDMFSVEENQRKLDSIADSFSSSLYSSSSPTMGNLKKKEETNTELENSSVVDKTKANGMVIPRWASVKSTESSTESVEDKVKIRNKIIQEITESEKEYVMSLQTLIQVYVEPLSELELISQREFDNIFSNIEQIYELNVEFLEYFMNEKPLSDCLTLLDQPFFRSYSTYCVHFASSIDQINQCIKREEDFAKFIQETTPNLNELLILPLYRICRYPLLFGELIKHTPSSDPSFEELMRSFGYLSQNVNQVYELNRKQQENAEKRGMHKPKNRVKTDSN